MPRTCTSRAPPSGRNLTIEGNVVSRLMFRAIADSRAKSSAFTGRREEICKSDPSSAFAWVSIPVCTLAFSEWIATSAAMPDTIASAKITSRTRCDRLSRHAIRQVHGWNRAVARERGRGSGVGWIMEDKAAIFTAAPTTMALGGDLTNASCPPQRGFLLKHSRSPGKDSRGLILEHLGLGSPGREPSTDSC